MIPFVNVNDDDYNDFCFIRLFCVANKTLSPTRDRVQYILFYIYVFFMIKRFIIIIYIRTHCLDRLKKKDKYTKKTKQGQSIPITERLLSCNAFLLLNILPLFN